MQSMHVWSHVPITLVGKAFSSFVTTATITDNIEELHKQSSNWYCCLERHPFISKRLWDLLGMLPMSYSMPILSQYLV